MAFIDRLLRMSVLTALCAVGLCMATEKLLAGCFPAFNALHLLVLGSTLLVYNTPRLIRNPYGRRRLAQPYRAWYMACFVAGLAATLPGIYLAPRQVLLWCIPLCILAFSYFLPVLPFKTRKRIRDFGWMKISVLAAVWTIATSVLPMLYHGCNPTDYPVEILLRGSFIFTLCMVFDIRDVRTDRGNNITTLPLRLGLHASYRLIYIMLLLFVLLSVAQYFRHPDPERLAGALLTSIATLMMVGYLRRHPSDRAYMALADGVMLLYAGLVLI